MDTTESGGRAQSESSERSQDIHTSGLPGADGAMRENSSSQGLFDQYEMNHGDRGYALIFNNRYFEDGKLKERRGTDKDLAKMIPLLRNEFGFKSVQVEPHHDVTRQQMIDLIKNAAAKDYTKCDCFVCVILSHGTKEGEVYGADGQLINIADLMEPLKGGDFQASQSLIGKPKIFIVQACPLDEGVQPGNESDSDAEDGALDSDQQKSGRRVPSTADFFMAWSSMPGSLSPRGSLFIQTLNEVVRANHDTDDLLSMLTKVIYTIADRLRDRGAFEVPYIRSMLTKKVFFRNTQ